MKEKVILIGLNGVTFDLIKQMDREELLPNVRKILEKAFTEN